MTTERTQSAIREVRDQLALDFADGERLTVVGSNLGVDRPIFGFNNDDSWRAIVKSIALQFKQVRTRFEDIMAILFGPRVTEVTGVAIAVTVGDRTITVNDSSNFPQLGTLTIDEGLATEETLEYCYIDRVDNIIFLVDAAGAAFAHTVTDQDAEQPLLLDGGTTLVMPTTRTFPTTGLPYVVTVGRGTANEEVAEVTAVDQIRGTVTLSAPLANTHEDMTPSVIFDRLRLPYAAGSVLLVMDDSAPFPGEGVVLTEVKTGEFTAVSGTVNDVTVAGGTFVSDIHNGQFIRFLGNVTPALIGVEVEISDNTASVITFSTPLGSAPAAGDLFHIIQPPFNATAGSPTSVTVSGGTFTIGRQVGNVVVFDGNVTAALAGVEAPILENTDSVLTFPSALPGTPASGDTFRIRARVEYVSNDFNDTALNLYLPIFDLIYPEGVKVELLTEGSTIAVGQVQVKGCGWDIFEVTPREVDIFLPEVCLEDETHIRSASYLHTTEANPPASSTLAVAATAGDSFIDLVDFTDFPIVGVVSIDLAGTNERVGYYKNGVQATGSISHSGATILDTETFVLDDGTNPAVTFEFDTDDSVVQSTVLRKVDISAAVTDNDRRDAMIAAINSAPFLNITASTTAASAFVSLINDIGGVVGNVVITETVVDGSFVVAGMSGGVDRLTIATQTLANSHLIGSTVDLYEPTYPPGSLLDGDIFTTPDIFPGPYLYDAAREAPTATVAVTTLSDLVSGPTTVEIDQVAPRTALEVENASAFDLVSFPYTVVVGRDTGNRESVVVTDVNLRERVGDRVIAGATVDPREILVTLSGGGAGDAADFPTANGYRVLISTGEVVYVIGTATGPDRLLLEDDIVTPLVGGETVSLLADVLTVNALTDFHEGKVPFGKRSTALAGAEARFPALSTTDITSSEIVEPLISSFDVVSATGLDVTGGRVLLNFGEELLPQEDTLTIARSPGDTLLTVTDSDRFPTSFPFVLVIAPGHPTLEERHLVTANNTGLEELTINGASFGLRFAHAIGTTVRWEPGPAEAIEYDSVSGNTLSFSPAIVLQSTHSPTESVTDSSVDSVPRNDGYSYPFRMPPDIRERIKFLFDLTRAAGVQVTFIEAR